MSERDWLGLELVEAPGRDPRAAGARPRRRPRRHDRGLLGEGRRHDRRRHRRQRGFLGGGAACGGRSRPRDRAADGGGRLRLLRPAAAGPSRRARPGDGLLPVQQRRRRGGPRDRRVRRRARPDPRLGRPPRQRHRGDLLRLLGGPLLEHPPESRCTPGPAPRPTSAAATGEGYTVNLPVPPGSGSDEFLALVQHVVAPIAREWRPGLLCISAGYDAHRDDPLANCERGRRRLRRHDGDDARAGGRARRAAAHLPRGRLFARGAGPRPSWRRSRRPRAKTPRDAPIEPAAAYRERLARFWPGWRPRSAELLLGLRDLGGQAHQEIASISPFWCISSAIAPRPRSCASCCFSGPAPPFPPWSVMR